MGAKQIEKVLGSKSYVGIFLCVSFCHKLLSSKTTATQRELYYFYKGGSWTPWSTQAECNESQFSFVASFLSSIDEEIPFV